MGWETVQPHALHTISDTLHYGLLVRRLPRPRDDGAAHHPAGLHQCHERARDRRHPGDAAGDAHLCVRAVPRRVLFQGRQQGADFPMGRAAPNIDNISAYYEEIGFKDWTHKDTGAPMLKIQHPEFEMWSSGIHARSGVACADCHMPYMRDGAVKVSDHWLRSPLDNVNQACQTVPQAERAGIAGPRAGDPEHHGRPAAQQREGDRRERSTRSRLPRRPGCPTTSCAEPRRLHRQAISSLGLRLLGEQHRLPQPAGSGACPGQRTDLARQAQIRGRAGGGAEVVWRQTAERSSRGEGDPGVAAMAGSGNPSTPAFARA